MKCYYHAESDAVGTCKSCQKGLCPECAADVGNGIACKDKCEEEVRAVNELIERNKTTHQKVSGAYSRNSLIYALLGGLLLLFGLGVAVENLGFGILMIFMGSIFLLGAIFQYYSGQKLGKK